MGRYWSSCQVGSPVVITCSICGPIASQMSVQHSRPRMPSARGVPPLRAEARAVRVVVDLDQLRPPPQEHRIPGGEQIAVVVRRLCGQLCEGPSGVLDQSKAAQSARISPGPSNRGSVATLPFAGHAGDRRRGIPCFTRYRRLTPPSPRGEANSSRNVSVGRAVWGGAVTWGMAELVERSARTPLWEVARVFLRLGMVSFGGPAAHVALMEEEIVRRRRWLTREEVSRPPRSSEPDPGSELDRARDPRGYSCAGLAGPDRRRHLLHRARSGDRCAACVGVRADTARCPRSRASSPA
jgi:hypothetical protein